MQICIICEIWGRGRKRGGGCDTVTLFDMMRGIYPYAFSLMKILLRTCADYGAHAISSVYLLCVFYIFNKYLQNCWLWTPFLVPIIFSYVYLDRVSICFFLYVISDGILCRICCTRYYLSFWLVFLFFMSNSTVMECVWTPSLLYYILSYIYRDWVSIYHSCTQNSEPLCIVLFELVCSQKGVS